MLPPPIIGQTKPSGDGVRELTPEEIYAFVKPRYDVAGETLPNLSTSTFVGVVRNGKVIAALGLQVKLHAEPLIIEPGQASVLPSLITETEKVILSKCGPQWVYLFAPAGKISQLAASCGMQLEPWCVYSRLVVPETPAKPLVDLSLDDIPAEGATQ